MNREEAIRKIRWYLLGLVLTDDVREAFNTLVPELVEKSTDEKMLDAILCHVKASCDFTANGVSKEDMVAYLEGKKKKAAIESAYPTSMPEEYGMRKPTERHDMVAMLKEHLANTPREQLDAEWKALEKWNDVGPTVEEYIYGKIPKFKVGDKIRKIGGDYASWEITGINSILRLYEGKYEEGYPTELSFEEQDSYELATDKPIKTENDTVDIPVSELCENDDERIRNELIDILEKSYEFGGFTLNSKKDLDRYLGYLEKQKGQPTNKEMLRTLRAEYEKGVADTIAKYEQKEQKPFNVCEQCPYYKDCPDYNEKKQEWSGEDWSMLSDISLTIRHSGYDSARKGAMGIWLRTLPERFNLQPKNEWSKEEKQKLNRIYEILGYAADDKGFLKSKRIIGDKEAIELQDFLKSLPERFNLQPKQEWSEEDEKIIDSILDILRANGYHSHASYLNNLLKSLRPSRKPNEVRYYEGMGIPKINGVPVPTETQTVDISGDVRLKGWVKRKTADGTLRLYESKTCEDRGIWVPPWVFKDSWKVCTTDDPIEVEITLKQL